MALDLRLVGEKERDGAVYDSAVCVRPVRLGQDGQGAMVEEVISAAEIDHVQSKRFYPRPDRAGQGAGCWHVLNGESGAL